MDEEWPLRTMTYDISYKVLWAGGLAVVVMNVFEYLYIYFFVYVPNQFLYKLELLNVY